jgi:hypothetical protein
VPYDRGMRAEELRRTRITAGIALIVVGCALSGARVVEILTRGESDGDNPDESLRFLAEHGDAYVITGILLVMVAASLVVAAVATRAILRSERESLWVDAAAISGYLGAGALGIAGVMRVAAPGPLAHISNLDADWGDAAYLVVQMAGTQSLFAGGVLGMSAWLVGVAIGAWRRRTVARGVLVLAVFGLDFIVALAGPLAEVPDWVFVVHLFSLMVGVPVACAAIGAAFVARGARGSTS